MKSGKTREKMVGYNTVPPPATTGTLRNDRSSPFRILSSSLGAASSSSNFPLLPKQEKPSYNACPPPPNLYGPSSTTPPAAGSHSDKGKGGLPSSGSISDSEKKIRRKQRSKSKSDATVTLAVTSDSFLSSGKLEGSGGSLPVQNGQKQANGAPHSPSASLGSFPDATSESKHASEIVAHSPAGSKLLGASELRIADQIGADRSDKTVVLSDDCPNLCTTKMPALSDLSCSVEIAGHSKSRDMLPSGIPKATKSKDANKNAKLNGGSNCKKSGSAGGDQKPLGQKGWRPCPSPAGIASSTPSGWVDSSVSTPPADEPLRTSNSGSSVPICAVRETPAMGPCPSRSLDAGISDSSQSLPQSSAIVAPAVHILGPPEETCISGTHESSHRSVSYRATHFNEHISLEDAAHWVEVGLAFKGVLRVNAYYRSEGYVTVEGIPVDVMIDGLRAQNRAMEGDEVAVQINHPSLWPPMKSSNNRQNSFVGSDGSNDRVAKSSDSEICDLGDDGDLDDEIDGPLEGSILNNLDSSREETVTLSGGSPGSVESRFQLFDDGGWNAATDLKPGSSEPESGGKSEFSVSKSWPRKSLGNKIVDGSIGPFDLNKDLSEMPLAKLMGQVENSPGKRPTGNVMAIIRKSTRREAIIGFLEVRGRGNGGGMNSGGNSARINSPQKAGKKQSSKTVGGVFTFIPVDKRFSRMLVYRKGIPDELSKRIKDGDPTVSNELVVAQVDEWRADSPLPKGSIKASLGTGGTIEAQTEAILLENAIHGMEFSPECLACLPAEVPWTIPKEEKKKRLDLRGTRIFTIDPPTAKDLDDALSIENLPDGKVRIGVHIADVSYFVHPDTALDIEAQKRSTSVYLIQKVLPMLPSRLCEELCSLNPGVDRLAFSVVWIMDPSDDKVLDQWIGRTIIRSCAKLTYGTAQGMIDGTIYASGDGRLEGMRGGEAKAALPNLHGDHSWKELVADVRQMHEVASKRRENRFDGGAVKIESSQLIFHLDEDGEPFDHTMYQHQDSNFLVEEFMLLANMTIAKIISTAFPERSLLRRHPEPNERKLREFEEFCVRKGFELDTSSSGALHISLQNIREKLNNDLELFNILMLYATKPMQLAKYFCTGDLKGQEDIWVHYALAAPLYTHFTSPIRRYPDLVVHRLVAATLDAERTISSDAVLRRSDRNVDSEHCLRKCFSGSVVVKGASCTDIAQRALGVAAEKHKIPKLADLSLVAAHCNEKRLACRNVKEASDKLYLWSLLKRKQGMLSTARVLAVGPKFMSVYVSTLALERRIYYDDVEWLSAEWFEAIGTLILGLSSEKLRKGSQMRGRSKRTVTDVALVVNPAELTFSGLENESHEDSIMEVKGRHSKKGVPVGEKGDEKFREDVKKQDEVEPTVLPLTLREFSTVPVSIYATRGENGSLDIAVRLYVSSYAI